MRRIIGAALTVAAAAGVFAAGASASAVQAEQQTGEICYAEVVESRYERPTVITENKWSREVPTYGDIIEKETRTRTWEEGIQDVPSKWWVWSPNDSQGPQEYTPDFPSDERGTWQGPKTDGGPDQNTYGTFNASNGNSGNSSWFHRSEPVPGTEGGWSEWGPWTDWDGAGPLNDDGRARGPLPHGSGPGWERQYRYVVVGQFQNGTTTETTDWVTEKPAGDGWSIIAARQVPGAPEASGWVTSPPEGEGWTFVESRTVQGGQIPCPIPPSTLGLTYNQDCAPDGTNTWRVRPTGVNQAVAWELFQDGVSIGSGTMEPGDGETVVEVARKQPSTAVLKWDSDGNGSLDKETAKASGPDLTFESNPEKCVIEVTPVPPSVTPPTCDAAGSVSIPEETIGYDWVKQDDGTYLAVADRGYVFPEDFDPTFDPGNLAQLDGPGCDAPLTTVIPTGPVVTAPDCSAAGSYSIPGLSGAAKQAGVTYTTSISADASDETGTIVVKASPDAGYKFAADAQTTWKIRPSELAQVTGDTCVKDEVVALPPTPPTQTPPPVVALPPAPPQVSQLPPTAVAPASGPLPATGSSTGSTLLLALAALGTGSALLGLRRRPA